MRTNGDPHSIREDDVAALRVYSVTEAEIVETLEIVNLGNSFNVFCDSLEIGPDAFLTYAMEPGKVS